MILETLMWWVLVQDVFSNDKIPRAMGPYPSKEMCRIAAERIIPDDRQFWTPERVAKVVAAEKLANEERDREIASHHERNQSITLKDGSSVFLDEKGKVVGLSYGGRLMSGPLYRALTGCVEIK